MAPFFLGGKRQPCRDCSSLCNAGIECRLLMTWREHVAGEYCRKVMLESQWRESLVLAGKASRLGGRLHCCMCKGGKNDAASPSCRESTAWIHTRQKVQRVFLRACPRDCIITRKREAQRSSFPRARHHFCTCQSFKTVCSSKPMALPTLSSLLEESRWYSSTAIHHCRRQFLRLRVGQKFPPMRLGAGGRLSLLSVYLCGTFSNQVHFYREFTDRRF